ncbi:MULTISPECIES: F0F1 ATP synthase subunit B [unclassified Crossiella]|uniref:F0F1 ATP synthase subunit B n=1 Tax=unclassified Crossiella TaxID=2620835 RepID=UPI001FFF60BA|nr:MULTISPECIES: F0F1 ATP synthase subunit B [unclassified Crossiella]MCK2244922.1 F0F1 ATP synthase subunit B [Crossiella sp. S99.2]MCK2258525.1 F0F1 ATP synthase subunit B [Crossiella sp. S99.1]
MTEVSAATVLAAGGELSPLGLPLGEIILGLIAFGIVLWVLNKYAFPQFEKAYSARTEAIEGGIAKAEKAQAQAQEALDQYRAQLADARAEAARIRDDARAEGQQIVIELREQAQAESERIVAQGQAALAAQRAQIVAELRGDLGRIAVDLAGRVVGESLEDEARRRGTVDRFLDELDATSAPAGK